MSTRPGDASREAQWRCPDTCSEVDSAIGTAIWDAIQRADWLREEVNANTVCARLTEVAFEAVKHHGTEKLRTALIAAEGERLEVRDELVDARDEITRLKVDVDEVTEERDDARRALADAQAEIAQLEQATNRA